VSGCAGKNEAARSRSPPRTGFSLRAHVPAHLAPPAQPPSLPFHRPSLLCSGTRTSTATSSGTRTVSVVAVAAAHDRVQTDTGRAGAVNSHARASPAPPLTPSSPSRPSAIALQSTQTSSTTRTGTPSSSATGSSSGSASASITGSVSLTGTRTPTDTPQSRTASRSATRTRTPSVSPTRSGAFSAWADTVVTLRVGDDAAPASLTGGRALPVYVDVYRTRPTVARILSVPLPTAGYTDPVTRTYSGACTLATGSAVGRWNFDREGFPSNSADGAVIIVPCYDVPVGSAIGGTSLKTIAVLDRSYAVNTSFTGAISMGVKTGTPTPNNGWRQVASPDGASFWTSSVAAADSGYRYIARPMRKTSDGAFVSVAIFPKTTATYKAGANDARGIAIYGGKLYATAGSVDSGFDRVFNIGFSTPPVAPTDFYKLMMAPQLFSPWTFVFTSQLSLWVAVDRGAGAPGGRGVVQFWGRNATTESFVLRHTVVFSATQAVLSIAGRVEFGRSFVYGVTPTALLRYDSAGVAAKVTTVLQLAPAAANTALRGVMFPGAPLFSPSRSASPSPKSRTATPTKTRTVTPTRSRSMKKLRR
jgi:hypothetical protein